MIGFLEGDIAYTTEHSVLINVQGVGYEVRVHDRLQAQLKQSTSQPLRLTTHLISKDDGMELYGFHSPQEKEMFLQLTRVSGIGPRTALAIFSLLDLTEIARAIIGNHPEVLCQAPGIGKKTAQRIILELRETLSKRHADMLPEPSPTPSDFPVAWQEDIELTLVALGFHGTEVQKGLTIATQHYQSGQDLDEILRLILAELSD